MTSHEDQAFSGGVNIRDWWLNGYAIPQMRNYLSFTFKVPSRRNRSSKLIENSKLNERKPFHSKTWGVSKRKKEVSHYYGRWIKGSTAHNSKKEAEEARLQFSWFFLVWWIGSTTSWTRRLFVFNVWVQMAVSFIVFQLGREVKKKTIVTFVLSAWPHSVGNKFVRMLWLGRAAKWKV